uniref:Uncharacterized protein n=1 Tax=Anguilla anguilla TaxID=7936 RepID=A0A0E9SJ43_ANGAN
MFFFHGKFMFHYEASKHLGYIFRFMFVITNITK